MLRHCPNGDRDAAVRRAWDAARVPARLTKLAHAIGIRSQGAAIRFAWNAGRAFSEASATCVCARLARETLKKHQHRRCSHCCAAIRAAVECPTWAELAAA